MEMYSVNLRSSNTADLADVVDGVSRVKKAWIVNVFLYLNFKHGHVLDQCP